MARQTKENADELDGKCWPKDGPVHTSYGKTSINSYSKAKARLDAAITKARENAGALPPWRVHDLRRTLATGLQKLGTRFEVTEAMLNHVSGSRSGVAGIYQQHDWKAEKRTALEAWARHVAKIFNLGATNNVVVLDTANRSA